MVAPVRIALAFSSLAHFYGLQSKFGIKITPIHFNVLCFCNVQKNQAQFQIYLANTLPFLLCIWFHMPFKYLIMVCW